MVVLMIRKESPSTVDEERSADAGAGAGEALEFLRL